ncbi:MAG TPA: hypothetical protein VIG06_24410 [Kofleriaceae bacterium]
MKTAAQVIALLGAAFLGWSCGKSDDSERKEGKAAASRAAAPAEPAADVPPEAPDPGTAAPASPTSEEQATADKAASVLEELGKIAEEAKGNCDKAAAAMKAVIDKNKAVLSAAEKLGQDEGKEKWLAEMYGPRTDAAKSKLMPLMEKCADHDGIATVFDSIE